jgi:hypothetical protein
MRLEISIILPLIFISTCFASDNKGNFAVKGIGTLSCERFVKAKDTKDSAYIHFGGWIEGYISATNKFLEQTYDIMPWQTTETIATIAYSACTKSPQAKFAGVVNEIVSRLSGTSLGEKSELINLSHGKYSLRIPAIIYEEVKKRLRKLNFLTGESTESDVKAALEKYQSDKGLTITSLPDQYTLWNLLDKNTSKQD